MADLRALFVELGHREVSTYIASGNVLFTADDTPEAALVASLEAAIQARFGFAVPVILRIREELDEVIATSPYAAAEPSIHAVYFLDRAPTAEAIATLDPQRSPPDEATVVGRNLYLRCPNTFANTKWSIDYIERRLGVRGTARNWNTVHKLRSLL